MLQIIILISLLAIGGAILGQWIAQEPGYILISFANTSIETTLWVGVFVCLCIFLVFWLIYLILRSGLLLPTRIRRGMLNRKNRGSRNQIRRSLVHLVSGNYTNISENSKSIFSDSTSIEMLLINAEAFLKNRRYDKLIEICKDIQDSLSKNPIEGLSKNQINKATDILMARAYKEQGKRPRALKLLQPYANDVKNDNAIFSMLIDIYIQDKRWLDIGTLLSKSSSIQKKDNMVAIVTFFNNSSDLSGIKKLWTSLDRSARKNPEIVAAYATALGRNNSESSALDFLQDEMKNNYQGALVDAYKGIKSNMPLQQLKFLEDFIKTQPIDKYLLSALAQLSQHNLMQAKARSYYEQLLQSHPDASMQDRLNYARILEDSNNSSDRQKAYEVLRSAYPAQTQVNQRP